MFPPTVFGIWDMSDYFLSIQISIFHEIRDYNQLLLLDCNLFPYILNIHLKK